jgi:TonB-dependent starch-binding outer membrane protein SusC
MRLILNQTIKQLLFLGLFLSASSLFAQDIKVSGVVTDKDGPVIGASVLIKGAKMGTVTDLNGGFTLNVPSDGVLTISSVGYESQNIKVKGQTTINVFVREAVQNLEEVVVVGYGTQKKRDISGSIVSLSAKEINQIAPINIASALQGRVSGLEIVGSSEPGAGTSFKIRGASTLTDGGGSPLFIVDGMEVASIESINPRDVASMEVLKDAASTAIYGSKSANGVILITTKSGEATKPKLNITYSGKQSQLAHNLPQMSRLEGIRYEEIRNFLAGKFTTVVNRDSMNPAFGADNNYQDLVFRKAYTHQIDFSIAGADKKMKYFVGTGYLNEQGIQLNSYNNRLSTRINFDYLPVAKLTLANRIAFSISDRRSPSNGTRVQVLARPANFNIYEPDGSFTPMLSARPNPLAQSMLSKNDTKTYDATLNEFVEYKFFPELVFKTSIAGGLYHTTYQAFNPSILNQTGTANSRNDYTTRFYWTNENTLSYNKKINDIHTFTGLLGFSLNESTSDYLRLTVKDNISDAIQISNAYNSVDMSQTFATWTRNRMASFFGRLGYNYKGRYIFNSNVRYDGSSRFGSANQWGFFPSASMAWRVSDEFFMEWTKPALKDAKVRLSYGVTGSQNIGDFASLDLFSSTIYGIYGAVYPSQVANPTLRWEQTNQLNTGVDLSFLEGRLAVVMDYYNKRTNDVLFPSRVPQTNGYATVAQNVGIVSNKGVELSINSTNIRTKDFEWSTSVNLSFNKNMIEYIPDGGRQFVRNVYILDKGYAAGTLFGFKKNAIFAYDESNAFTNKWEQLTPVFNEKGRFTNAYTLNGQPYNIADGVKQMRNGKADGQVFKAGDVMWDDVNKDGVIDANDRQVLGCGQPFLTGGFNSQLKYKGFSLSAYFTFSFGADMYNYGEFQRSNHKYSAITKANPYNLYNSWLAPGDIALFPKPDAVALVDNTREASDLWIEDGSYIRLRNLKFGYDIPKSVCKSLKIESMNLFAMAQDLFTWTNYTGYDPEIPTNGFSVGWDYYAFPRAESLMVGLNFNF